MTVTVEAAYAECERITREQARNFFWGIRLLPPAKRSALCAVYAFARRVDDIGDGTLPDTEKLSRLDDARRAVADPGARPDDPVLVALADAAARLPIPLDAFGELVSGCEQDVRGHKYADLDDLVQLLPLRRRLDRPAVAGRLLARPRRPARGRGVRARRRPGRGAAADERAARHPRGPDQRPGVPADRRPRPVRRHARRRRRRPPRPLRRRAGRADPVRGRAGVGLVRPRAAAAAAARPAQRRLLRGDGRHLPRAAAAHRRRSVAGDGGAAVAAGAGRSCASRGRPWAVRCGAVAPMAERTLVDAPATGAAGGGGREVDVVVVGGGLAGISAALRCADEGRQVVAARVPAAARRHGHLVPA